jgi:hypothetical protein
MLRANEVAITFPQHGYTNVARLVIGGFAARTGVSIEAIDDVQLALELVLAWIPTSEPQARVALEATPDGMIVSVGPFAEGSIRSRLSRRVQDELELGEVLGHLVDVVETDASEAWLTLRPKLQTS